jgi:hypothetical protein
MSSVAVLAVGTGIEWLARRMAGPAARAAGRALISTGSGNRSVAGRRSSDPDVTVDEVVYVRKVQVHR